MLKLVAALSPILLAVTLSAGFVDGQSPTAGDTAESQPVTIAGCVVRNGSVDVDKGTRDLDLPPGALALTDAHLVGATNKSGKPDSLTFALIGQSVNRLEAFVGKRVEVVGRVVLATDKTPPETQGTRDTAHPSAQLQKLELVSFRGISGGCS